MPPEDQPPSRTTEPALDRLKKDYNAARPQADAIFYAGLGVGLLLTFAGFFLQNQTPDSTSLTARLIMVCGLGIVLGAFGATATINYKAYVMGGCGAIALILGFFLSNEDDRLRQGSFGKFAQIQVRGLPDNSRVAMIADTSFFHRERGFSAARVRYHELIATEQQLAPDSFIASITLPESTQSDAGTGLIDVPFNCIPTKTVRDMLGKEGSVRWSFKRDSETGVATLSEARDNRGEEGEQAGGSVIASSTDCPDMAFSEDAPTDQSFNFFGIAKAFAADISIEDLIRGLEADSPLSRREARNGLAKRGPKAIQPMMAAFNKPRSSYRVRLGSLVAINGILQRDDVNAGTVRSQLSDGDIEAIVSMSAVKDATMRRYASAVLSRLGDDRTVEKVLGTIGQASDGAQSDLLAAIKPAYTKLSNDKKQSVGARLKSLSSSRSLQTRTLVEQTTNAGSPNAAKQKFFVVVGSFTDLDNAKRFAESINTKSEEKAAVARQRPGDPLFRVMVGDYLPRDEAEKIKAALLSSGTVKDAFLSDYPDALR